jgi:hypothetical protein
MRRRRFTMLELLVVLGLTLSGLFVGDPMPVGTNAARVNRPEASSAASGGQTWLSKRAQRKQQKRQQRRQDRKQQRQKNHQQGGNGHASHKAKRVGNWHDYCLGADTIPLRDVKLCTHGPDKAPPRLSASQAAALEEPHAVVCDGNGQDGFRIQVLYVRGADGAPLNDALRAQLQALAAGADQIYELSALETGAARNLRFVQDASCQPTVDDVTVSSAGLTNFNTMIDELQQQGFASETRIYLAFAAANTFCGIGTLWSDDRPVSGNWNNVGPSYARVDARTGSDSETCWRSDVAAHEVMHNLGGVQLSAPHTSGGFHCIDEYDIMCYSDAPYYPKMEYDCPNQAGNRTELDCNHDDYYNTDPAAGSYLAQCWNAADNQFLIGAHPLPDSASACGASPPPPPHKDRHRHHHHRHKRHRRQDATATSPEESPQGGA